MAHVREQAGSVWKSKSDEHTGETASSPSWGRGIDVDEAQKVIWNQRVKSSKSQTEFGLNLVHDRETMKFSEQSWRNMSKTVLWKAGLEVV